MKKTQVDKLEICKRTRKVAADSLLKALKKLLSSKKPISETILRDTWLLEMRKNIDIFPDGWYMPPPHGMGVVFGTIKDPERINFPVLRKEEFWPKDDVFLDRKEGIIVVYASPVDKSSLIIGDFGLTLYLGKNPKIQNHLKNVLKTNREIADQVKIGMKLSDVNKLAPRILKNNNLQNAGWISYNDPTGINFGHTIPFTGKDHAKKSVSKPWNETLEYISKQRKFLNAIEQTKIIPGLAFTIEPRMDDPNNPKIPRAYFHTILQIHENGEKEFLAEFDELFTLSGMDYMLDPVNKDKINYAQSGVNYEELDPAKTLGQKAGRETAKHLKKFGFPEVSDSRGESAFVWRQKNIYMASVTESLGTKNLVADAMREVTKKTYYDAIGYDTIATALNDLTSVGAKPLVVTAFWAVGKSSWFNDIERITDLVNGWKQACDDAEATWGGGESPSYNNVVNPDTIALGGNVVGIISHKKRLLQDKKIKIGDRILFLKSTGINANGLSLSRAIAKKLPKGFGTKLPSGMLYGEAVLKKTNIYAKLIQDLLDANIDVHYISNITGHGLRKVMRGRGNLTYVIEKIFEPQEVFLFIQKHAGLSDYEIYETYNMGQDFAIFLPEKDIKKTQQIVKKHKFESVNAGYVEKGNKQVVIKPKNIIYKGDTLQVRL